MRIIILTYGSRGDVQPFLALAVGLQKGGHTVKLAAPQRFTEFVTRRNISFVPLAGDPEIISKRLNIAGANPIGMMHSISGYIFSIGDQVARQAFAACKNSDLIIHSFLFTTGGHSLARKHNIPDISVQTFPVFAPTRAISPVSMPNIPPGPLSYFFHWLITQVFWHGGNFGFRQLKKRLPETFDLDLHWPFSSNRNRTRTPLVLACSPTIIPQPDDWNESYIHIPGYFFLDEIESYQPPVELREFLSAGKPPVCVTFGSTIYRNSERVYRAVLDALAKTHNRVIILSGWSNLQNVPLPGDVFMMDSAPHDWLLPQCKAIIHHGGAGSTAAGLRAGIPTIIMPSAADQPFWGKQVHAIGVGPKPVPIRKLTVEKLVEALIAAEEKSIRNTAQVIGRKIRNEDGIGKMVQLVDGLAAKWGRIA